MNKNLTSQQETRHANCGIEYVTATNTQTGEEFVYAITMGSNRRCVNLVTYEQKPSLIVSKPRTISTWHAVDELTRSAVLEMADMLQQFHANRGAA